MVVAPKNPMFMRVVNGVNGVRGDGVALRSGELGAETCKPLQTFADLCRPLQTKKNGNGDGPQLKAPGETPIPIPSRIGYGAWSKCFRTRNWWAKPNQGKSG